MKSEAQARQSGARVHGGTGGSREADRIAIQVGKMQVAAQSLYELGVPLREAFRMTNLTPDTYERAFVHYRGILEEPTVRTAIRSGCWRFVLEPGGQPDTTRLVLQLGPYADEADRNDDKRVAWLEEWLIRPFGFRRIEDEVGVGIDGSQYLECYVSEWPLPLPVMARVQKLLRVPKRALDEAREHEAFSILETYFGQTQP